MTKVCLMCGDTFPDSTTFCPKDGAALRAAVHSDDVIGEVFCDRYVVTDLLGEGGMGAVYVARDVRLPQQVAVKVLRERAMADPSTVARFRQEAEAASRINHDRVARVSDFGFMADGRAYLIMEYVKGQTLKHVMDERGPITPAASSRIAGMIAEGLDAAHRLGIVHRDLKPDNVMIVDDQGGGVRVKLLDFGIAKVLHSEETAGRTATGFVIGTPQWMSPEQILGSTIDARSDIYSLGLLVFAMLSGQRAFKGATQEEMMARLAFTPNRLANVLPDVQWPDGLQALLDRTLSRDVHQRPDNALVFAQELSAVVGREAPKATQVAHPPAAVLPAKPPAPTPAALPAAVNTTPAAVASSRTVRRGVIAGVIVAAGAVAVFVAMQQGPTEGTASSVDSATLTSAASAPAGGAANTEPSVATPDSVAISPSGAPSGNAATPQSAQSKAVATNLSPPNNTTSGNARPPAASGAARGGADTATPITNAASALAAQQDLSRVMDEADANVGTSDNNAARSKARETIRKLELLVPKLSAPTDRGNAHFYIGMSQATLGENAKACASVKRAEPFAKQSPALQNNIEQWLELLKCSD